MLCKICDVKTNEKKWRRCNAKNLGFHHNEDALLLVRHN